MESKFPLNQILQRYNLASDTNLLIPYEAFKRINIDQQFIYALLQLFENEKSFCEKDFRKFTLEVIIDYIKKTHTFYLTKKLAEIDQSIQILLKDYSYNHPLLHILNNFFSQYKTDLTEHINEEERQLLPYIKFLLKCNKEEMDVAEYFILTKNYCLHTFIETHHDTEESLSKVKEAIILYRPPTTNQTPYRILLSQLESLEKDLSVHALIEDHVLIPRAIQLERELNNRFLKKIKLN